MAPSATEVQYINETVLKDKDIHIEHNADDHVAFGKLLTSLFHVRN